MKRLLALVALLVLGHLCNAAPALAQTVIPGLFNTGVDDSGNVLADGEVDPHYALHVSPDSSFPGPQARIVNAGYPIDPEGPWVANSSISKWIAPAADQSWTATYMAPGQYIYRTTFNLTGFDLNSIQINGQWSADDEGTEIVLNGRTVVWSGHTNFYGFVPFTATSGFVSGVNTLDFKLTNVLGQSGVRVELAGTGDLAPDTSSVPEPASAILFTCALGTVVLMRRSVRPKPDNDSL